MVMLLMNPSFWRDRHVFYDERLVLSLLEGNRVMKTGVAPLDDFSKFAILTLLTPPVQGPGPFGGVFVFF